MDDELNTETTKDRTDPDRWSDMSGPLYLPDDWFDEPPTQHQKKPWNRRPWVIVLAIVLAVSMAVYYTIPILVPVHEDPSKIPQNESIYYT